MIARRFDSRLVWGLLLIVGGALFLLQNFNLIRGADIFWAAVFGIAGMAFVWTFANDRAAHWWALIPGFALVGVSALLTLGVLAPQLEDSLGGPLFLGALSLSFWLIYLNNRQYWWAVIPGGALLTLALVAGTEALFADFESGGVFFLGLALTFALLALVPTPQGRMRWAFIPAAVLGLMGVLLFATRTRAAEFVWPAALIAAGLFLIARTFWPRRA
jgi:hypothetical protein